MIDWDSITDRTRNLETTSFWKSPADILRASAKCFKVDKWKDQETRVEVWIEKEALKGVMASVCDDLETPYFACKGYVSQSEMWSAAMRIQRYHEAYGQNTIIIHLGDHDPSGIDMTRDIRDRITLFLGKNHSYPQNIFEINHIALNFEQIQMYNPPPNPAKTTDSRYESYIKEYGDESWELDALEPKELTRIVKNNILFHRDETLWNHHCEYEKASKETLADICNNYAKVEEYLKTL